MPIQIQYRRGTAAQWSAANTRLAAGEPGYETDTGKFKVGDGSTAWSGLSYFAPAAAAAGEAALILPPEKRKLLGALVARARRGRCMVLRRRILKMEAVAKPPAQVWASPARRLHVQKRTLHGKIDPNLRFDATSHERTHGQRCHTGAPPT